MRPLSYGLHHICPCHSNSSVGCKSRSKLLQAMAIDGETPQAPAVQATPSHQQSTPMHPPPAQAPARQHPTPQHQQLPASQQHLSAQHPAQSAQHQTQQSLRQQFGQQQQQQIPQRSGQQFEQQQQRVEPGQGQTRSAKRRQRQVRTALESQHPPAILHAAVPQHVGNQPHGGQYSAMAPPGHTPYQQQAVQQQQQQIVPGPRPPQRPPMSHPGQMSQPPPALSAPAQPGAYSGPGQRLPEGHGVTYGDGGGNFGGMQVFDEPARMLSSGMQQVRSFCSEYSASLLHSRPSSPVMHECNLVATGWC